MLTQEDYIDRKVDTEDYATILLHYENGAPGVVTISQLSSGRKNRLLFEINGSKSSLAWSSERPNELWIGHRSEPNQVLYRDPALMSDEARSVISYPGGHNEGFPDTFKQLYKKVYAYILDGDFTKEPNFPTFETGHYEMKLIKAIEKSAKTQEWVKVDYGF
jgi:predicted dehydrogenase